MILQKISIFRDFPPVDPIKYLSINTIILNCPLNNTYLNQYFILTILKHSDVVECNSNTNGELTFRRHSGLKRTEEFLRQRKSTKKTAPMGLP